MALLLPTLAVLASTASISEQQEVETIEVKGVRSRLIESGALKDDISKKNSRFK